MASPVLEDYNTASSNGNTVSSLSFTKPSGVSVGDILFIIVGSDDSGDGDEFSINATNHPGWTKIDEAGNATVDAHIAAFYKIADNDIDENTVTIDAASADEMQGIYGYITGGTTTGIESGIGTDTSSPWLAPNPNMLQSGKDCIIIYGMSMDGGDGGTITVSNLLASPPGSKLVQVNSGTGSQDNVGCYGTWSGADDDEGLFNFVTGSSDDGVATISFVIYTASTPRNVTCTTEALTLTESINNNVNAERGVTQPAAEGLTLTENNATVDIIRNVQGNTEALTLTENDAFQVNAERGVTTQPEQLTLTEQNATVQTNVLRVVTCTPEALTLTEQNASINRQRGVTTQPEALTLTEQNASVDEARNVQCAAETLQLIEVNSTVNSSRTPTAQPEVLTLTEQNASVNLQRDVTTQPEALTLTESDATISTGENRDVTCTTEALSITEQASTVTRERQISTATESLKIATQEPSPIVSLEKITVSFSATDTKKTVNLTKSQSYGQCVPYTSGRFAENTTDDEADNALFAVKMIDNAGTPAVEIERSAAQTAFEFTVFVVEYISDIRVQQITWNSTSGPDTNITIPIAVVQNRTFAINHWRLTALTDNNSDIRNRTWINSTTTVIHDRSSIGTAQTCYGTVYVVEDISATNEWFSRQEHFYTLTADTNQTITSVDISKSVVQITASNSLSDRDAALAGLQAKLTSSTNLFIEEDGGASTQFGVSQVIEWKKGLSVQQVRFSDTNNGFADRTITQNITAVDLDNSIIIATRGQLYNGTVGLAGNIYNHNAMMWELDFQSTTVARSRYRSVDSSNTRFIEAQVVEFISGAGAQISFDRTVSSVSEALTLTENNASANLERGVAAGIEALTLTEQNATVTAQTPRNVDCTTEALTLTENNASINRQRGVNTAPESLLLTEQNSVVLRGTVIECTTEALTLTENNASVNRQRGVNTTAESLLLTEQNAVVGFGTNILCSTEALTLTESNASLNLARGVQAAIEALLLTETPVGINGTRIVTTPIEITLLAENAANINRGFGLSCQTEVLVLTENNAQISTSDHRNVICTTEALALEEQPSTVNLARGVAGASEALTLDESQASANKTRGVTGSSELLEIVEELTTINSSRGVTAQTELLSLVEQNGTIISGRSIQASSEQLLFSTASADLNLDLGVVCSPELLALSTNFANVSRELVVTATTEQLIYTGLAAGLNLARGLNTSTELLLLTTPAADVDLNIFSQIDGFIYITEPQDLIYILPKTDFLYISEPDQLIWTKEEEGYISFQVTVE